MKNIIKSKGRVWKRRSKNLVGGEIECVRCGHDTKVKTFKDEHFTEEFICRSCKKELKDAEPKPQKKKSTKPKVTFPDDCPHKPFFNCKRPSECRGCYYNPEKKMALLTKNDDDEKKTAREHWFYGNKKHSKDGLKLLDDIKHGRGLHKGGNRTYFKYARKSDED